MMGPARTHDRRGCGCYRGLYVCVCVGSVWEVCGKEGGGAEGKGGERGKGRGEEWGEERGGGDCGVRYESK